MIEPTINATPTREHEIEPLEAFPRASAQPTPRTENDDHDADQEHGSEENDADHEPILPEESFHSGSTNAFTTAPAGVSQP